MNTFKTGFKKFTHFVVGKAALRADSESYGLVQLVRAGGAGIGAFLFSNIFRYCYVI